MSRKGMLLVMMQPPAHLEEEYNDWYDTEHLPDRMSAPGFELGRRYVAQTGGRRSYVVIYDLADRHVLETPEYRKLSGNNFTPWTKRLMRRIPRYRVLTEQIHPGESLSEPCANLLLMRFSALSAGDEAAVIAGVRKVFGQQEQVAQWRVFAETQGDTVTYFALIGSFSPVERKITPEVFGRRVAGSIDLVLDFVPYRVGMTWERAIGQD